jgi:hypothetical protein
VRSQVSADRDRRWVFEDTQARAFQIVSPVPNPWGQEWKILFSKQFQKSDRSKWPYRLQLKLFEPDEQVPSARILREEYKGVFSYTEGHSVAYYAHEFKERIWISYSVILI